MNDYTLQYEHEGRLKFLHYPNPRDALLGAIGLSVGGYKPLRILTPNGGVHLGERALAQQIVLAKLQPKSERGWIEINDEIDNLADDMTKARRIFEEERSKRRTQAAMEKVEGYGTF